MKINWNRISGYPFEELCTKIMSKLGFSGVKKMPHNTYGIDIEARCQIPLLPYDFVVVAQCKTRAKGLLSKNDLNPTFGYIATEHPQLFILFTNAGLTCDASKHLQQLCESVNCGYAVLDRDRIESLCDRTKFKIPALLIKDDYLDRISRTQFIVESLEDTKRRVNQNEHITIRIRATFTSMSNIRHYADKRLSEFPKIRREELDDLLEQEAELMLFLLKQNNVKMKCICYPSPALLSNKRKKRKKYYTENQRRDRKEKLKGFLSYAREHTDRISILCDRAAKRGNQLLIDEQVAIMAPPRGRGYTESFAFHESSDKLMISFFVKEFDLLFDQIMQHKQRLLRKGENLWDIQISNAIEMLSREE